MSQINRLILAIVIVAAGIAVLARSYFLTRPPPALSGIEATNVMVTEVVKASLDPARFDPAPSFEMMSDVYDQIRRSVLQDADTIESIRQIGPEALEDLGEAFVERLRFMIAPELERDYLASARRGDPLSRMEWGQRYEKYIEIHSKDKVPALDAGAVELAVLKHDFIGRGLQQGARFEQGFDISTGARGDPLPAPSDPVAKGMLAVEIVMPMMRLEMVSNQMRPAIVGFHFVWNPKLKKWIAYESVVYMAPGSAFSAPRL